MRYFSKESPRNPIWLANGEPLKFDTLDGKTGFIAIEAPEVAAQLEKCQREHRGGITEIQQAEFEDNYAKKKPTLPAYVYRSAPEAIGQGMAVDTLAPRIPAVPLAANENVPATVSAPEVVTPAKPKVGKRPQPGE